uniref:C2H2-type domain-containing protein n=1 Tax=Macrostomum lignano TaxID=282301 RepID=A0A1I8JS82_9PLAT
GAYLSGQSSNFHERSKAGSRASPTCKTQQHYQTAPGREPDLRVAVRAVLAPVAAAVASAEGGSGFPDGRTPYMVGAELTAGCRTGAVDACYVAHPEAGCSLVSRPSMPAGPAIEPQRLFPILLRADAEICIMPKWQLPPMELSSHVACSPTGPPPGLSSILLSGPLPALLRLKSPQAGTPRLLCASHRRSAAGARQFDCRPLRAVQRSVRLRLRPRQAPGRRAPDALGGGSAEQSPQLQARVAAAITAGCGSACPDCGRGFVTRRGLRAHRSAGGGCPIGRVCAFCQRPFDLARHHLLGHLAERHPRELRSLINRGVCPLCVASAGAAGQLLRHLASAHGLIVSLDSGAVSFAPRPGAGRAPHDCPACSRCFATELQLRDHMLTSGHGYRCHRCPRDDSLLPSKEAWVAHCSLLTQLTKRGEAAFLLACCWCIACPETFQVGLPLTCHLLRSHTRPCLVRLKRLSPAEVAAAAARPPPAKRIRPAD